MANRRYSRDAIPRRQFAGLIFALVFAGGVQAAPPTTAVIGTLPQPEWSQLTPRQKEILAPLAKEWNALENVRRKKWLGIVERYPTLKPAEQQRLQERMREWVRMTPEQRSKVRGTYQEFQQWPDEQKQVVKQKWEAYLSLSPEERQRLRETGKSSRLLNPPVVQIPPVPPETLPAETGGR